MDTKKISALLLAVEMGSLTAAANELGYTQSGMTHMMNSLEDELGVSLLIRSKTGVHLSPSGQSLLPDMRSLISAAESLVSSADKLKEHSYSTLNLGSFASVSRTWLPSIVADFHESNSGTDLVITMGDVAGLYNGVRNEHYDCAIVSYQESLMQGLSWIPLRDDELVAIIPEEPVWTERAYPVGEFNGSRFLMPASGFEMDIMPIFESSRTVPDFRYTNMDDGAIASMVEHKLGVSILSELIVRDMVNDVQMLPLDPPAYRRLGIIVSSRRMEEKHIRPFVQSAAATINKMYREV